MSSSDTVDYVNADNLEHPQPSSSSNEGSYSSNKVAAATAAATAAAAAVSTTTTTNTNSIPSDQDDSSNSAILIPGMNQASSSNTNSGSTPPPPPPSSSSSREASNASIRNVSSRSATPPDFLSDGDDDAIIVEDYQNMDHDSNTKKGRYYGNDCPHYCTTTVRLEDMSHRPTTLREFFSEFWTECRELGDELIHYSKAKTWKKKVLTVLLVLSSLLVFYDLLFGNIILHQLENFIRWMTNHSAKAVVAFVCLFVLSTLIFIPPTLLIFGAGYAFAQAIGFAWGIVAAILSCAMGSCIGAIIAFLRSRYMMRDLIHLFSKRYPLVRAADRALKRNGFHIMLLLRLCPLIPFNGLNYICGITGVSLEDFTMSLVGVLPFQIFTIMVGATTGTLALRLARHDDYNKSQQVGFVILLASGIAFGLLALVQTWKFVKKELRKELDLTPEEFKHCLHAEEEERLQDGIEPSIEVSHLPRTTTGEGQVEHWFQNDEEWFWIWA